MAKGIFLIYRGDEMVGCQTAGLNNPMRAAFLFATRRGFDAAELKAFDINTPSSSLPDFVAIEDAGPEDSDWYARDVARIAEIQAMRRAQ